MTDHSTKKKAGCFSKFLRFCIVCGILLVAAYIFYKYGLPYSNAYRDQYADRQTSWDAYDPDDIDQKFALLRVNNGLEQELNLTKGNVFLLNRLSAFGSVPSVEECTGVKYKCGDELWQTFSNDVHLLDNRCMVKIPRKKTCTLLLPNGSLVTATNKYTYLDGMEALFAERNLLLQVVMTDEELIVKQGVTEQISILWHIVSPIEDRTYIVEIGDQKIYDTGTVFGTYNAMDEGALAVPVTKGSVQVVDGVLEDEIRVYAGSYSKGAVYDVSQCPAPLKACGTSCIPGNAVCCSEISGSYCLSPLVCENNYAGKCSSTLFSGEESNYCCASSSAFMNEVTVMLRGSYDCQPGMKFCGMGCIPEDQPCCYPTDKDCVETEISLPEVKPINEVIIPREYFNNVYSTLLGTSDYLELIGGEDFLTNTLSVTEARNSIQDQLEKKLAQEYDPNNKTAETKAYCESYPGHCEKVESSSGSNSASGNCPSTLPSDLRCSCGKRDANGWVPCSSQQSGYAGDWSVPLNCLQARGMCK